MLIVADEKGDGMPLLNALTDTAPEAKHGFLIGPEGGFSDEELTFVDEQSFCCRVDLGRRILRAETAALYVLSVCNAVKRY